MSDEDVEIVMVVLRGIKETIKRRQTKSSLRETRRVETHLLVQLNSQFRPILPDPPFCRKHSCQILRSSLFLLRPFLDRSLLRFDLRPRLSDGRNRNEHLCLETIEGVLLVLVER